MPKSPAAPKRVRKSTRVQPTKKGRDLALSDDERADENYEEQEKKVNIEDRSNPRMNACPPLRDQLAKEHAEKRKRNINPRSDARKEAMYAQAQKNAKELATSGVNMLKEAQERLRDMHDQELQFDKLEQDCHSPLLTHDEIFGQLQEFYSPVYNELRRRRQEKISDVSRMLQNNAPSRQEALKEMSKKARRQLEQAKVREKEATDAAELIKRVKNMLRI